MLNLLDKLTRVEKIAAIHLFNSTSATCRMLTQGSSSCNNIGKLYLSKNKQLVFVCPRHLKYKSISGKKGRKSIVELTEKDIFYLKISLDIPKEVC